MTNSSFCVCVFSFLFFWAQGCECVCGPLFWDVFLFWSVCVCVFVGFCFGLCVYTCLYTDQCICYTGFWAWVCECARPETLLDLKSHWENSSKWTRAAELQKGSRSAPIMKNSGLRESSGTNTSHIMSLFSLFFVSSIQRNMAEMCNYLFEALCF